MKLRLFLLSATAALCLTWPAAVLADPPSDHGGGPGGQADQHGGEPAGHGGGAGQGSGPKAHGASGPSGQAAGQPAAHGAPPGRPTGQTQSSPSNVGRSQTHAGPTGQGPSPMSHATPAAPPAVQRGESVRRQAGAPQGAPSRNTRPQPSQTARQPAPPPLAGWNRAVRGPDRDQAGQQWRQSHAHWDNASPWRRDPNWWRGDASFRLFSGARLGFFFIPEIGYVSVPSQYEKHYWQAGDTLPSWFWRYVVNDYERYDLPQPPDGCVWVWVDNDVALIDASDGYILDIVHNAW
jgi:Ni/Co efflux regulator RcnB